MQLTDLVQDDSSRSMISDEELAELLDTYIRFDKSDPKVFQKTDVFADADNETQVLVALLAVEGAFRLDLRQTRRITPVALLEAFELPASHYSHLRTLEQEGVVKRAQTDKQYYLNPQEYGAVVDRL